MGIKTDITLYTEGTPNGLKASIVLEELGLEYKVVTLDFNVHEQKESWFLEINPNGRIPALTDKDESGREIKIFESGAILLYIIAKYDKDNKISYPYGTQEHWETVNWVCLAFCVALCFPTMLSLIGNVGANSKTAHVANGWSWSHAGSGQSFHS
jgi:glutathione S-transferase